MKLMERMAGGQRLLLMEVSQDPGVQEMGLFLTRSITILGEYYLVRNKKTGTVQAVDAQGQTIPLGEMHRDFLRNPQGWREIPMPDIQELLAL